MPFASSEVDPMSDDAPVTPSIDLVAIARAERARRGRLWRRGW
jgi:hypothetical protein